MWELLEHRRMDRQLAKAPREVLERYEKWKDIARLSGPPGIRLIAGFHDEALAGKWKGSRSSRLGDQWRVIYRVVPEQQTYYIESVTPHDYRRP
jgi:mRNA-degrading endonuclease YafQ of YafQ-DinJ toxin-antitoxin module